MRMFKANPVIRDKRLTSTVGFGEKINRTYRLVITEKNRVNYANFGHSMFLLILINITDKNTDYKQSYTQ